MLKNGVKARWTVDSFDYSRRIQGTKYTVSMLDDGHMHCTCDAFKFGQGLPCKHIQWVENNKDELQPDEVRSTGSDVWDAIEKSLKSGHTVTMQQDGKEVRITIR